MLLSLALLSVTACAKNIPVNSFCAIYEPVFSSVLDTEETLKQIDKNNAAYDEVCIE